MCGASAPTTGNAEPEICSASLLFNPLTRARLPASHSSSERQRKSPGFDQRDGQNFPAVTMALFTHYGRVLQSSEEKGIFDVFSFGPRLMG